MEVKELCLNYFNKLAECIIIKKRTFKSERIELGIKKC